MSKQFSEVSCKYGAPMGRQQYGTPENCAPRSVNLFRVKFVDGDYDDGGAYWGGGSALYCARSDDGEYQQFMRAESRSEAAAELGLPALVLKRPTETVAA